MNINIAECELAGVDPSEVKRVAEGLSRYAKEAERLGLGVFGESGAGQLRPPTSDQGELVLAALDGPFNGYDGGTSDDSMIKSSKWYFPVAFYWLYIATILCGLSVIFVSTVNWALGVSAGAALFGIAQPGLAAARKDRFTGKKYKDLTKSERKAMWLRVFGMTVTMTGFGVGINACG